jgi:hypothetical protein
LEFCKHYKKLGVTNLIIYDNNDIGGERISDVLTSEIENGFVIIEEFFGKQHAQRDAYQNGYDKYNDKYDWIAFFDIDEHLVLNKKYKTIDKYLSSKRFCGVEAIRIPWRIYGDCGQLRVVDNNYALAERFKKPSKKQTYVSKAIVRGGIDGFYLPETNDSAHIVRVNQLKNVVDADGNKVTNNSIITKCSYKNAALNHYITKTIEEFVTYKTKKGLGIFANNKIYNSLDGFFTYNEKTEEKINLASELLNIGNNLFYKSYNDYKTTWYSVQGNHFVTTQEIANQPYMCQHQKVVETINENFYNIFDFTKSIIDIGAYDGGFSLLVDWYGGSHMFERDKNLTCLLYTNIYLKNKTNNHHVHNEVLGSTHTLDSFNIQDSIGLVKITNYQIFEVHNIIVGALGTLIRNVFPPIIFEAQLNDDREPVFFKLLNQLGYTIVKNFSEKNIHLAFYKK